RGGRRGAPPPRSRAIANGDGVDRRAEEPFDESGRSGVGADEIAEGAEYGAFAEDATLLEQSRGRWGKSDAFSLQTFERAQLRAQRRMELLSAAQLLTGGDLALARVLQRFAGDNCHLVRLGDPRRGNRGAVICRGELPARCFRRLDQMRQCLLEHRAALGHLVALPLRALAVEVCAVKLFA